MKYPIPFSMTTGCRSRGNSCLWCSIQRVSHFEYRQSELVDRFGVCKKSGDWQRRGNQAIHSLFFRPCTHTHIHTTSRFFVLPFASIDLSLALWLKRSPYSTVSIYHWSASRAEANGQGRQLVQGICVSDWTPCILENEIIKLTSRIIVKVMRTSNTLLLVQAPVSYPR